VKRKNSLGGHA